uniref:Ribosomal protein S6 kinase beta-2 (Trinotate prediction) n=1 Tax=Myxobolus squamalis TaxID=59785 RepID=A0A6B2G4Z2_MYXSQ
MPPFYAGNDNIAEMYKNICNNEVVFRVKCSLCAKGFIQALLKKNPTERLGYGPGDWNDIKQHAFLRNILWDDLYNRRLKPPFDPSVANELDFKNIDSMFLEDEIPDSIINTGLNPLSDNPTSNQFVGFTYVQDKELD